MNWICQNKAVKSIIAALILMTAGTLLGESADLNVEISLDRNKGYIGDRIRVELTIRCDSAIQVDSIDPGGKLGDFEISEWHLADLKSAGGKNIIEYSGVVAAFNTGKLYFPSLPIAYYAAGVRDTILTDSISVYILSLVMDDSAADIKKLKDVKSMEGGLNLWTYLVAAAIVTAVLLWYFMRRRRTGRPIAAVPPQPPWEEARIRLRKLRQAELGTKQYYIILADIARRYIQRRYGFSALDMTTSEILAEAGKLALAEKLSSSLQTLLFNADLVKFARLDLDQKEREADWERAWEFVTETSPIGQEISEVRT